MESYLERNSSWETVAGKRLVLKTQSSKSSLVLDDVVQLAFHLKNDFVDECPGFRAHTAHIKNTKKGWIHTHNETEMIMATTAEVKEDSGGPDVGTDAIVKLFFEKEICDVQHTVDDIYDRLFKGYLTEIGDPSVKFAITGFRPDLKRYVLINPLFKKGATAEKENSSEKGDSFKHSDMKALNYCSSLIFGFDIFLKILGYMEPHLKDIQPNLIDSDTFQETLIDPLKVKKLFEAEQKRAQNIILSNEKVQIEDETVEKLKMLIFSGQDQWMKTEKSRQKSVEFCGSLETDPEKRVDAETKFVTGLTELWKITDNFIRASIDEEVLSKNPEYEPIVRIFNYPLIPFFPPGSPVKETLPELRKPSAANKETPSRGASRKEHPSKEAPSKKTPSKEAPSKKTPSKEHASKEAQSKKTPSKGAPSKKTSSKVAPCKNALNEEDPSKEDPSEEVLNEGDPSKDDPSKEAPSREAPSNEASSKGALSKDDPSNEASSKGAPSNEALSKEDPSKEVSNKEDLSEEDPSKGASSGEAPGQAALSEEDVPAFATVYLDKRWLPEGISISSSDFVYISSEKTLYYKGPRSAPVSEASSSKSKQKK